MTNHTTHRDLDMSDVEADALNDPSLDRDCEEGANCTDTQCPLIHPDLFNDDEGFYDEEVD